MSRPKGKGEVVLVPGARDKRSFAYHIALALLRRKATVAIGCEANMLEKVTTLVGESGIGSECIFPFDASIPGDSARLAAVVGAHFGRLDSIIHCAVWTDPRQIDGKIWDATPENFQRTLQVSALSLNEMVLGALPYLHRGSVITGLTFPPGSERHMKGYRVIGLVKAALEKLLGDLNADLGSEGKGVAYPIGPAAFLTASSMVIPYIREYMKALAENAPQGPITITQTARQIANVVLDGTHSNSGGHPFYIDNGGFAEAAMLLREGITIKELAALVRELDFLAGDQKEELIKRIKASRE